MSASRVSSSTTSPMDCSESASESSGPWDSWRKLTKGFGVSVLRRALRGQAVSRPSRKRNAALEARREEEKGMRSWRRGGRKREGAASRLQGVSTYAQLINYKGSVLEIRFEVE